MSPLFYEDSLGAKLVEKATAAMDAAREQAAHPDAIELATSDEALVDDPQALAQAESLARGVDAQDAYEQVTSDWVSLIGPSKLSGLMDSAGTTSYLMTAPLEAAGIPFAWDPYPPEEMPGYRYGYGAVDRPFELLVPADRHDEALSLISTEVGSAGVIGLPIALPHSEQAARTRRRWMWAFFAVFLGFDLLLIAAGSIWNLLGNR